MVAIATRSNTQEQSCPTSVLVYAKSRVPVILSMQNNSSRWIRNGSSDMDLEQLFRCKCVNRTRW